MEKHGTGINVFGICFGVQPVQKIQLQQAVGLHRLVDGILDLLDRKRVVGVFCAGTRRISIEMGIDHRAHRVCGVQNQQ